MNEELDACGWDDPLSEHFRPLWEQWKSTLGSLSKIKLPRCLIQGDLEVLKQQLNVFCDASELAIGFVMYMKTYYSNDTSTVSFVLGDSKVAPRAATSVPRLELCAAVLAALSMARVVAELRRKPSDIFMFTDSLITLGYIANTERRFTKYISRRVCTILTVTTSKQWHYVSTEQNPADIASRPHQPADLVDTCWLSGPEFMKSSDPISVISNVQIPCNLPECKEEFTVLYTQCQVKNDDHVYERVFSITNVLNKAISIVNVVLKFLHVIDTAKQKCGVSLAPRVPSVPRRTVLQYLIRHTEQKSYGDVISRLQHDGVLPESHPLNDMSPFLDNEGIIRVGGRIENSTVPCDSKHPVVLPSSSRLTDMILQHYHEKVGHQGRHLTHGAIRSAGFHIHGGRQLVRKFLANCVNCRKLRAPTCTQFMTSLPSDRLAETPPFENVGLDIFGPFFVHDGCNTRRTKATKKAYALIFVCAVSRAVHIELLPAMDTSSFRNAFARFIALRGTCKIIRSDRGSNLMSARQQLEEVNLEALKRNMDLKDCQWLINPPSASHFGGAYERKIGSIRRVLEGTLLLTEKRPLSRDELNTFLQESASIVNGTPLWEVSDDPNDPCPLSPKMLLTLREKPETPPLELFEEKDLISYGKLRWRRTQYLVEQFWVRWKRDYLYTLQRRHKWTIKKPCIAVNDIVMIRDKNSKRHDWPVGKVKSVKYSQDGLVRSVCVLLQPLNTGGPKREVDRAITDLVLIYPSQHHCKC